MTQIKRLYASSGPEVIIETLQITIGSDVHYLCQGYDNIAATTENGDTVTFSACAIDIALLSAQCGRHAGPQVCLVQYRWCCVHGDPQCAG